MLCLKYYRATSGGWWDTSNSDTCFELNQHQVRNYSFYKLPDAFSYTICNGQPPFLQDIASHTLFGCRLKYFRLTAQTTYQEFVGAAMSNNVETEKLLPPEYTLVRVWCRFHMFSQKFQRDCPGQGTWHAAMSKEYSTPADVIKDLVEQRETMWCSHCEKEFFSKNLYCSSRQ
jgi:hypothetical protein